MSPEEWKVRATPLLIEFVAHCPRTFTGEDALNYVVEKIGEPHHPNAKGSVFRSVVFNGPTKLAVRVGMVAAKNASSHGRPYPLYKSTICPEVAVISIKGRLAKLRGMVHTKEITITEALEQALEMGAMLSTDEAQAFCVD